MRINLCCGVPTKVGHIPGCPEAPLMQKGTEVESSIHQKKYEVGRKLTFRGYDPDEKSTLGEDHEYELSRGDRVEVLPENRGGFGIMVRRISDGKTAMVWPTEVQVTRG